MDDFTKHYIVTALWSSNDESDDSGGEPLDSNYSTEDLAPCALSRIESDCAKFQADNASDLATLDDITDAGHDFWLTRNGHGVGFWDRPEKYGKDRGDRLTQASEGFGECYLYVGDDGQLYI